ncbi:hypothetical protein [Streptomyces sp. NPDC059168]
MARSQRGRSCRSLWPLGGDHHLGGGPSLAADVLAAGTTVDETVDGPAAS